MVNEYESHIVARNQPGSSAYSKTDCSIFIRAPRQGISSRIEKFFNQTINGGSHGRIEATIIGSPEREII
ncbi:unnamed protein product [Rotaria sp. Silwood2]|nr:unnamed protein product [Rotaria sp. Silwood2]CAF3073711.1 unnamed protein product [Rotaria sp. Silwood2]CAF4305648.1 unnamed protein product [Rotaria sp. Silwood2]